MLPHSFARYIRLEAKCIFLPEAEIQFLRQTGNACCCSISAVLLQDAGPSSTQHTVRYLRLTATDMVVTPLFLDGFRSTSIMKRNKLPSLESLKYMSRPTFTSSSRGHRKLQVRTCLLPCCSPPPKSAGATPTKGNEWCY